MIVGIDVSRWQGPVDFSKAAAQDAKFAYLKATQNIYYVDGQYRASRANAKAAGLLRGAYHYLVYNYDPVKQAEHFWNTIKDDPGELPPCIDFEEPDGANAESITYLELFANCIEQLSGRVPVIYTGLNYWEVYGSTADKWLRYPLWFSYPGSPVPAPPKPWIIWSIHQYTWKGDGHAYGTTQSLSVDLDRCEAITLEKLTGAEIPGDEQEETTMKNAIGLFTKTSGWDNAALNFIIGWVGKGASINANLKAIETQATAENRPLVLWYDFDSTFYSDNQYMALPDKWPPVADDLPLQKLITALTNRTYRAVIVNVTDNLNHTSGKSEDPGYLATAAEYFCKRVSDWLKANRPGAQFVVSSSNAFIEANAPVMNNWVGRYNTCAFQKIAKPLVDNAWPDTNDKPAYLDNRPTCEFWRYWEIGSSGNLALMIYRMGDDAALRTWLRYGTITPPPDTGGDDGDTGNPPSPDLAALTARVTALENEVDALTALYQKHTHGTPA